MFLLFGYTYRKVYIDLLRCFFMANSFSRRFAITFDTNEPGIVNGIKKSLGGIFDKNPYLPKRPSMHVDGNVIYVQGDDLTYSIVDVSFKRLIELLPKGRPMSKTANKGVITNVENGVRAQVAQNQAESEELSRLRSDNEHYCREIVGFEKSVTSLEQRLGEMMKENESLTSRLVGINSELLLTRKNFQELSERPSGLFLTGGLENFIAAYLSSGQVRIVDGLKKAYEDSALELGFSDLDSFSIENVSMAFETVSSAKDEEDEIVASLNKAFRQKKVADKIRSFLEGQELINFKIDDSEAIKIINEVRSKEYRIARAKEICAALKKYFPNPTEVQYARYCFGGRQALILPISSMSGSQFHPIEKIIIDGATKNLGVNYEEADNFGGLMAFYVENMHVRQSMPDSPSERVQKELGINLKKINVSV